MPFDLSTARPVKPKGFDLSTARVAGSPAPVDPVRAKAESDTAAANARIAEQHKANGPDWLREGVRQVGRALTLPARGVVGTGALIEQGLSAAGNLMGAPDTGYRPLTGAYEALRPQELEARGTTEEWVDRIGEGAGGMLTGRAGAEIATKSLSPVAQRVGQTLLDNAGREAAAVVSGSTAGQVAHEAGAGPVGELFATVAGGAPAFIGAKPSGPAGAPVANPRPMGEAAARARQSGFRLTPDAVTTQRQLEAPPGVRPGDAPGAFVARVAGPEGTHAVIIENQKNADILASRDVGLEGQMLSPETLAVARAPHAAVFDEVAQSLPVLRNDPEMGAAAAAIGEARRNNPLLRTTTAVEEVRDRLLSMDGVPTQQALDAIRSYRQDATKLFRQAEVGGSGIGVLEAEQAAFAYRAAADALEAGIERQAGRLYPDLVPRLRDARTALAKLHNVEDSLVGGPGNYHVDAGAVAKLAERFPLSGWLAEIADFHNSFGQLSGSAVGKSNPSRQLTSPGALPTSNPKHAIGGWIADRFVPRIISDDFQNRFGTVQPGYDPSGVSPFARPTPPPSPFADYAPPGDIPGGDNVMPPAPGGGPALDAELLGAQFDELPPAGAYPGDLTADVPPAPGGLPFELADLIDAPDFGMEAPPSRFTGAEGALPFDQGLDFLPDPEMAAAPIVRGGGDPRTVQDTLLSDELMGRPGETLGRPLDADTADRLAPLDEEMVTRPDPDLGGEFDLARDPGTDVEPYVAQGEFIPGSPPKRPRPGKWDGAEDAIGPDQLPTPEGDLGDQFALPSPQPRLPAPIMDLLDELQLADDLPPPDDVRARYRGERDIPPGARVVESSGRDGYIATRPMDDGSWQIRSAYVKEGARGKGAGQEMLLQTAREASDEGVPLHSDSKLSEDQVRVYEKLRDKGMLDFDGDLDAAKQAMDETGNATSPDGQPWIRNIRPGPLS
jgi:predicted GNAT family acetyltransferase